MNADLAERMHSIPLPLRVFFGSNRGMIRAVSTELVLAFQYTDRVRTASA